MRTIKIERKKTLLGTYKYYVIIDNQRCGEIKDGGRFEISVNDNSHSIIIEYPEYDGRGTHYVPSENFYIPANDLDYYYRAEIVKKPGLLSGYGFCLIEDPVQKKKNDEELKLRKQINAVLVPILNTKDDKRDYNKLNTLSSKLRNTNYYKKLITNIVDSKIQDSVNYYIENIWDVRIIISYIENLAGIPEYKETVNQLLKHKAYFCPNEISINDGAIESVLPADDPISALNEMEAIDIPVLKKPLLNDYKAIEAAYKSDSPKIIYSAIRLILRCLFEKDDLDALKKWLLFFGVFREGVSAKDAATYRALLTANQKVFHPIYKIGDDFKLGKTVDMIIAEAMRCSRSGSFSDFDKDLEEFLKYTCPFRHVDKSQYTILLKVFAHINAYNEEKMVLQAMVDNMIERTPEQESRLCFLKDNSISGNSVQDFTVVENNSESGQFIYEYRTLNWNSKEIQDYFVSHSAQGVFDKDMSYVVAEWSKTINSSIIWDTDSVLKEIDRELKENYGDRLLVGRVKSGANSEWVEYVDSIYIVEKDAEKKEYRWLQFNISGENVTRKQIHIMVQALYWPGVDSSVIHLDDVYAKNAAAAKKTIALKEKQNPRWNVFINSIVEIAVGEIEKWINSTGDTEAIY